MQQFEGRSVEDALAAAARQLGEGLQVKSAQRVRRGGVLGFFAKEHYQVIAEPKAELAPVLDPRPLPDRASAGDGLDRVLQSLVEEVEAREVAPMMPARSRFTDADLVRLDEAVMEAPVVDAAVVEAPVVEAPVMDGPVVERPLRARPLRAGDAETIDLRADLVPDPVEATAVEQVEHVAEQAPAFYDFEVLDAQEIEQAPRWTRTALKELGLPLPVLKALPQKAPTTDIGWTQALEKAIAKVVPAPAPLDEDNDAQVSGFGTKGAINIIRAAVSGFTPGLLVIDGRSVPATAAELALAVRACLRP